MRQWVTPESIAAKIALLLRSRSQGAFVLCEGETDERLYRKFFDRARCRVVFAQRKKNVVKAVELLARQGVSGVLGIVDADFDRVSGRLPQHPHILVTDNHDLEAMLIASPVLESVLDEFADSEATKRFEETTGRTVRDALLEAACWIGCLRWVSERDRLSLTFRTLRVEEFTGCEDLRVDPSALVRSVMVASGRTVGVDGAGLERELESLRQRADGAEIATGHDLVKLLVFALSRVLGARSAVELREQAIEMALRLAANGDFFRRTGLYAAIVSWEADNPPYVILDASVRVAA